MVFLRQRNLLAAVLVGFCLTLLSGPALAGNGKIAGTVQDQDGTALPGATVSVDVGSGRLGTTSGEDGKYFILNVPPGQYTVKASFVGRQTVEKTEVKVRLDLTTEVDFKLPTKAIEGEVMTVVAVRPPVERSLTASRATIDANEINNNMPVGDLQDLINTTPSSFRGFIRGGRKADSKILVDGIDVSDTYFRAGEGRGVFSSYNNTQRSTGGEFSSVGINASSVQSLDILSGTFNAEYDAASAGVINVVTKEGGRNFEGRFFLRTGPGGTKNAGPDLYNNARTVDGEEIASDIDRYFAERDGLLAAELDDGSPDENVRAVGRQYTFNEAAIDDIGYGDDRPYEAELSIGGPLTSKGGFYFTTRFLNDHGHFANQLNRSARYSLKLTHNTTESIKLTGSMMIDDGGKLGGWVNRDFAGKYKFFPEGMIGNKKLGLMGYVGVTHLLSPETFYEVKISQLNRKSEFGFSDDNGDGVVTLEEDGDFIRIADKAQSALYLGDGGTGVKADGTPSFFSADPGNDASFVKTIGSNDYRFRQPGFYNEEIDRNVTQLKADLTHQLNYHHQLKGGVLYRRHTIEQFVQQTSVRITYDPDFPYAETDYSLNPQEFAFYVQDRIEYEGIIINGGLRIDGFDAAADQFGDFFSPAISDTTANGQILLRQVRSESVDIKWFVQPRLGISHPIAENAALYYSWGKFYSPPSFSTLYDQYGVFTNPSLPSVADVDRDPTEATAYEIGLQYSPVPDYLVDVTAYYRDIDNYGSIGYMIRPRAGSGFGTWSFVTSFGYADSRGIELGIERRPVGRISGRINYAVSYIKASGFSSNTPFADKTSFAAAAGDTLEGIPFDDRNTFNTTEANVGGGGNGLTGGFDRTHQISLSLLAKLPGEVDLSLISTANSGFFFRVSATTENLRDRETDRGPWNLQTDVRLTRGLQIGGQTLSAFLEVRNLFDRENIIAYQTGNPSDQALWEESVKDGDPEPSGELNTAFSTSSGTALYDIPRLVNLGILIDF